MAGGLPANGALCRPGSAGPLAAPGDPAAAKGPLEAACRKTGEWVRRQLGAGYSVIVRSPMVLGGDCSEAGLDQWHRAAIRPAQSAMAASYFTAPPEEPVTILLFSTEKHYRENAMRLFADRDVSRFGYYRPHLRTVLVNLEGGTSGLFHELTHALMAFDFPDPPEWLCEGLASLHECARLRDDGKGIDGLVNWRLAVLREAIERGSLPPLRKLVTKGDFRGQSARVHYAYARHFCLYLQDHNLLEACYRACRAGVGTDPTGATAVARLFPSRSWEQLDADFLGWLARLEPHE